MSGNTTSLQVVTDDIFSCRQVFDSVRFDRAANFDREAGFAVQVITGNEHLLKVAYAARQSIVDAVTNVAALGLSLNPAKKQVYLVPRKDSQGNTKIVAEPSYMGLVELAVSCGSILWAQAHPVREHDDFKRRNDGQPPRHDFKEFSDRGHVIAFYVVAKIPSGDFLTEVMSVDEINSIRDRSDAYRAFVAKKIKSTPWATDWEQMAAKTVAKRAAKWWRGHGNSERLDRAIEILNTDGGEGFGPIHDTPVPQVLGFDCDAFIAEAKKTKTVDELTKVYAEAIGAAANAKDRDGAVRFKEAALAHRSVLRKRAEENTIDV